jgi:hypothetical protein
MLPKHLPAAAPEWPRLSAAPQIVSQLRYRNFDYLRLFLAIEVVAGHLWAGLMRPGNFWVPIPPVAAFVGLSGFLIPQSLERSRDLWHFAWKRVVRTIPALVPLMVAIGIVFGFKRVLGAIAQYLTAGYYGKFVGVTLPLWSLIVEDALYACIAMLFVVGLYRKVWVTLPILAALIFGATYIKDPMTEYRLFHTSIAFFTGNLIYIFHDIDWDGNRFSHHIAAAFVADTGSVVRHLHLACANHVGFVGSLRNGAGHAVDHRDVCVDARGSPNVLVPGRKTCASAQRCAAHLDAVAIPKHFTPGRLKRLRVQVE